MALYGGAGKRWAFTERGASALRAETDRLVIGPSALVWDGKALVASIDEVSVPWPGRLRGTLRVEPEGALHAVDYALDTAGHHLWRPLAPVARVAVEMRQPRRSWRGRAYVDSNRGCAPLEQDLQGWQWSRTALAGDRTLVCYDVVPRGPQAPRQIALSFRSGRAAEVVAAPRRCAMARSFWGIERSAYADAGATPAVEKTLEDAPFYARTVVRSRLWGEPVHTVHESLDLDRFARRWVQALLPFRAPRRGRSG